jgi:hypothetical protein
MPGSNFRIPLVRALIIADQATLNRQHVNLMPSPTYLFRVYHAQTYKSS